MTLRIGRWQSEWQRWTSASGTRRILRASLTVGVISILPRLITVAKDLVVAHGFGTTTELDSYLVALILPLFAATALQNAVPLAVIPTYMRVRSRAPSEVAAFGDNMLVLAIALSTLVGLAGAAVAPVVLPPLMSHLSSSGASEVHQLYFALLPFIVLSTVTTLLSAVLNAHDRFGTTSSAPALTPALTIVMIIVAHAIGARGAFALATGLIAGACAELLVTVRALRATGVSLRLRWHGFDAHTRKVIEQYAPMLLTAFFAAASPMVDQSFAVRVGAGSVSAINYATKLVALSIALGYVPLSAATLPHLSGMVAAGQWADIRRALRRGSMLLALATVPATVLLMAVSRPLTAAIFERGAFTVEDTHIVSHLTSIYAAQIPFFLVSILPMRLLSAMGKNQHVMVITLGNVALNAFGDWALTARMGLAGIALSSALVCGWSCAVYFTVTAVLLRDKRAS